MADGLQVVGEFAELSCHAKLDAQVHGAIDVTVPARILFEVVSTIREDDLALNVSAGRLQVSSTTCEFYLPLLTHRREAPDYSSVEQLRWTDTSALAFGAGLAAARAAEPSHEAVFGKTTQLRVVDSRLAIACTDLHHLAESVIRTSGWVGGFESPVVVSTDQLRAASQFVAGEGDHLSLAMHQGLVMLRTRERSVILRTLTGHSIPPSDFRTRSGSRVARLASRPLAEALDMVGGVIDDVGVELTRNGSDILLLGGNDELGTVRVRVPADDASLATGVRIRRSVLRTWLRSIPHVQHVELFEFGDSQVIAWRGLDAAGNDYQLTMAKMVHHR